jgi:putative phosphoribosyl transferase
MTGIARERGTHDGRPQVPVEHQRDTIVPTADAGLPAVLTLPPDARGIVVFAHGSGRSSPRNRAVAETLTKAGLATLLLDLLIADEEAVDMRTARLRFDIGLLASRVVGAIDWLVADAGVGDLPPRAARLPVGCLGASTGAAAALVAAAERPDRVAAVVSRGGRPDLAGDALPRAPRRRCSSWAGATPRCCRSAAARRRCSAGHR